MHSEAYRRGITLFNSAEFYDAHEVLEDIWRDAPEPDRKFLQGLIQIAVALHHHSTGNVVGCRSLLTKGAKNLERYPEGFGGLELAKFLESVGSWQRALDEDAPLPPLPRVLTL